MGERSAQGVRGQGAPEMFLSLLLELEIYFLTPPNFLNTPKLGGGVLADKSGI